MMTPCQIRSILWNQHILTSNIEILDLVVNPNYTRPTGHLQLLLSLASCLSALIYFDMKLSLENCNISLYNRFSLSISAESCYHFILHHSKFTKCTLMVFFYCSDAFLIPSWLCFKLFRSVDETTRQLTQSSWAWTRLSLTIFWVRIHWNIL